MAGKLSISTSIHGGVVVKARLGAELRRIPLHNEDLTYDDLVLMLQRVFSLAPTDDVRIRYTDDEGDLVTMLDTPDLAHAIQQSRLLRIVVTVGNGAEEGTLETEDIRAQLRNVCAAMESLLDRLASAPRPRPAAATRAPRADSSASTRSATSTPAPSAVSTLPAANTAQTSRRAAASQFDPVSGNAPSSSSTPAPAPTPTPAPAPAPAPAPHPSSSLAATLPPSQPQRGPPAQTAPTYQYQGFPNFAPGAASPAPSQGPPPQSQPPQPPQQQQPQGPPAQHAAPPYGAAAPPPHPHAYPQTPHPQLHPHLPPAAGQPAQYHPAAPASAAAPPPAGAPAGQYPYYPPYYQPQ